MCALHRLSPAVVGESYGLAVTTSVSVYLSDLADGEQSHLLMVSVEARDAADLEEFLPAAGRSSRAHGSLRTQKANQ